jgi:hypothetical protein
VDASCASQGVPPFDVIPTQVMDFKNFRFSGFSHFDIGSGLPPLSITPADGTSPDAGATIAADRVRADDFDIGAYPESRAISPSDVGQLQDISGCVPQSWTDGRVQLHSVSGLLSALIGNNNHIILMYGRSLRLYERIQTWLEILVYGRFLRMYERIHTWLESELDRAHDRHLRSVLMNFHAQLDWRNWLVMQLDGSEKNHAPLLIFIKASVCLSSRTI